MKVNQGEMTCPRSHRYRAGPNPGLFLASSSLFKARVHHLPTLYIAAFFPFSDPVKINCILLIVSSPILRQTIAVSLPFFVDHSCLDVAAEGCCKGCQGELLRRNEVVRATRIRQDIESILGILDGNSKTQRGTWPVPRVNRGLSNWCPVLLFSSPKKNKYVCI